MAENEPPYETLVEYAPVGVFLAESDGDLVYANDRLASLLEFESPADLVSTNDTINYVDPVDEDTVTELIESRGEVDSFDTEILTERGDAIEVRLTAIAENGQVFGFVREITARKELERKTEEQAKAILEVEIPVVQVWDGVTLATVVGTLDTNRAQRLTEELLTSLMDDKSEVAILDITGVGTIDTATAQHLIETVNAVTLLGSEVVITGINPEIAQTMVNLNITMDEIRTKASLADGLKLALGLLDDVTVESTQG